MKCPRCGNETTQGKLIVTNKARSEWQCPECSGWNYFIGAGDIREVSLGEPPTVTLMDDVLKLHILYLEKVDSLNKGERTAYEEYLTSLSRPQIINVEEG